MFRVLVHEFEANVYAWKPNALYRNKYWNVFVFLSFFVVDDVVVRRTHKNETFYFKPNFDFDSMTCVWCLAAIFPSHKIDIELKSFMFFVSICCRCAIVVVYWTIKNISYFISSLKTDLTWQNHVTMYTQFLFKAAVFPMWGISITDFFSLACSRLVLTLSLYLFLCLHRRANVCTLITMVLHWKRRLPHANKQNVFSWCKVFLQLHWFELLLFAHFFAIFLVFIYLGDCRVSVRISNRFL